MIRNHVKQVVIGVGQRLSVAAVAVADVVGLFLVCAHDGCVLS